MVQATNLQFICEHSHILQTPLMSRYFCIWDFVLVALNYQWLYNYFVGPCSLLSVLILYTIGRTPWMGDQLVAWPLPAHRTTQTQNEHTQISMSWVGFETTTTALERAKTARALDRPATVIGIGSQHFNEIFSGYRPHWLVKSYRRFGDYLCPHHKDLMAGPDITSDPCDGNRDGPRNVGNF
jgi:hypothetical protein